jgi:hypothetical protein
MRKQFYYNGDDARELIWEMVRILSASCCVVDNHVPCMIRPTKPAKKIRHACRKRGRQRLTGTLKSAAPMFLLTGQRGTGFAYPSPRPRFQWAPSSLEGNCRHRNRPRGKGRLPFFTAARSEIKNGFCVRFLNFSTAYNEP